MKKDTAYECTKREFYDALKNRKDEIESAVEKANNSTFQEFRNWYDVQWPEWQFLNGVLGGKKDPRLSPFDYCRLIHIPAFEWTDLEGKPHHVEFSGTHSPDYYGFTVNNIKGGTGITVTSEIDPETEVKTWKVSADGFADGNVGYNDETNKLLYKKDNEYVPVEELKLGGTKVKEAIENKIDLLGNEKVSGEPYHLPYYFNAKFEDGKIKVGLDTITLDNQKTLTHYDHEIAIPTGGTQWEIVNIPAENEGTLTEAQLNVIKTNKFVFIFKLNERGHYEIYTRCAIKMSDGHEDVANFVSLFGSTEKDIIINLNDGLYTVAEDTLARYSELEHKVERSDENNQIYGTDNDGEQTTFTVSRSNAGDTIAQRNVDGTITVSEPTEDDDASTKKYVDDKTEHCLTNESVDGTTIVYDGTTKKISAKIPSVMKFKGSKDYVNEVLSLTGMEEGDVWYAQKDDRTEPQETAPTVNALLCYNGTQWVYAGSTEIDLSLYLTKSEASSTYQTKIDDAHKLSADLVSETSTNKFVSDTEKETWNAKQSAITEENKLSPALVDFTDEQTAAANSGITSDKVDAYDAYKTDKLEVDGSNKMTGDLTIEKTTPELKLNATDKTSGIAFLENGTKKRNLIYTNDEDADKLCFTDGTNELVVPKKAGTIAITGDIPSTTETLVFTLSDGTVKTVNVLIK